MTCSNQETTPDFAGNPPKLKCAPELWCELIEELRRRTEGCHESGAFLLGTREGELRRILTAAYYDDLDPTALQTGIVIFNGSGYGPLWELCRRTSLTVVADIHVHPRAARQSPSDKANPMIATKGHIALIVPDFATGRCLPSDLGVYEYEGGHRWRAFLGADAKGFFRLEEQ